MPHRKPHNASQEFEEALKRKDSQIYVLKLYVAGTTPRSLRAVQSTKRICDLHLEGRYELEIVDVYQQAAMAVEDQIVAVPTLVKFAPGQLKRLVGDLSDERQVLLGLGLEMSARHENGF